MKEAQEMSLSFAGSGFNALYYVGVSAFLQKYSPHLLNGKIAGASSGALFALALASGDISLEKMTRIVLMLAYQASQNLLGPFNPTFKLHKLLVKIFEENLSEDVAERVSGRLCISVTKVRNMKNELVSEFQSKADVIEAVCASAFIPGMSGWRLPKFRDQVVLDGGFTDNIPAVGHRDNTVTVSPFAGDTAICPEDKSSFLKPLRVFLSSGGSINVSRKNLVRFCKVPPNTEEMLEQCRQGWSDARRFIVSESLVRCETCSEGEAAVNCEQCADITKEAGTETLPEELVKIFEEVRDMEVSRKLTRIW